MTKTIENNKTRCNCIHCLRNERTTIQWLIKYGFTRFDMDELLQSEDEEDQEIAARFANYIGRAYELNNLIVAIEERNSAFRSKSSRREKAIH